ncbi:MAG: hypothetical protein SCARUB_00032 [Candidatus Scalindua rubra]|uniref:Uncharacterized protein n=1 Tax=Candidatus Scalindua rubra TaxID=1872076 RepID=A0A1E3XGP1_9BACT|nr:MAG: hypothetical protein SCARUB_00032 [Candidatus Scalindua rubra]
MSSLLNMVEKELKIPKKQLIEEGVKYFLEVELRNLSIEIKKNSSRYGVNSFNELWEKLESGELTESECFDDLSRLEYLELEKEKVVKLLEKTKRG